MVRHSQMIYLPYHSNDTPSDRWRSFDIEELVQTFPLLLFSKPRQCKVKDAIQQYHNQDKDIAVVTSLVHCYNEAEALHE